MIGGIGQNSISDLSKMMAQMMEDINNATINVNKKSPDYDENCIEAQKFAQQLEELYQKQDVPKIDNTIAMDQLGIPAGFNIVGIEDVAEKSIIPEIAGTMASSNSGSSLKNQATNFIQKLIDNYKDRGSIIGLNV